MTPPRPDPPVESIDPSIEPIDASVDAIAAAILDGTEIDWATASVSESVAAYARELRMVADIASLHRSLSDDEAEALRFPPRFPWPVGTLILTQSLGRGIYGEVFRAWDKELHRDVAVKLLFGGRQRGDHAARALDEGRLLARVRHPNVVAVHAVERIDGRVGLVTEYVKGQTLAEIARASGAFDAPEASQVGIDLCHALEAVHGAGLLHRDIKAQNVMRDSSGRVVLMDFGAGLAGEPAAALAGTPLYLAPEVLAGGAASRHSDIYSVGVLLHYLLTLGFPVAGESLTEIREAHQRGERVLLRNAARQVPRGLAAAIDAATDPDPARRPATAAALAEALARAVAPASRRRRLAFAAAAGVLLATGALMWTGLRTAAVPSAGIASETAARMTVPPYYDFGGPSFDGRYMVHLDVKYQASLTQIETGHTRRILEADSGTGTVQWAILSPDGTRAAYTWFYPDKRIELRIANLEDRWPASVVGDPRSFPLMTATEPTYIVPVGWSRDGTSLAVMTHRKDGPVELGIAAPDGTGHRVLHTFTGPRPRRVSFSGDGRFVTYDQPNWPSPERDIYIVPTDGSTEPALLIGGVSNDEQPMWSADGSSLIFNSDRDGSSRLWRVLVRNGVLAGLPAVVADGTQGVSPIAVTASGDYYYSLQTKHEHILTGRSTRAASHRAPPFRWRLCPG